MKEIVVWGRNGEWVSEIRDDFLRQVLWHSVPFETDTKAVKVAKDEFRRLYPNEGHLGPIMSGQIGCWETLK